ncbi:hypothetical protein N9Z94_03175 [Akkermansiaceae bacterium]|nr:hypothetical protein [bacterium]MDB4554763.1 hypothetical protein [Akkermansiaceae bacterium]
MILLLAGIAALFLLIEKVWPSNELPKVKGWWTRIALINAAQVGVVILAGLTWDTWFQGYSFFHLRDHLSILWSAAVTYFISTFIYY